MNNDSESGSNIAQEDYDPELDILSEQFNPLKALTTSKIFNLPRQNAPIYNNLAQFESAMKKQQMNATDPSTAKKHQNMPESKGDSGAAHSNRWLKDELTTTTRRFLPHQGMFLSHVLFNIWWVNFDDMFHWYSTGLVQGKGKKARNKRNALLNMEKLRKGPLGLLFKYKLDGTRIKVNSPLFQFELWVIFIHFQVHIRNETKIIGYVTGLIVIYDKHWNLVLSNVHEVWKRRKLHCCATANHGDEQDQLQLCMDRLKLLSIELPETKIKSLNRKFVQCSRWLPQLMIRGEQIAIISVDAGECSVSRQQTSKVAS